MERLNSKYNLDCFSNSELDSESDEGKQYQYEHGYETLIWTKNQEFVTATWLLTLFSKWYPTIFSFRNNCTKIFNLVTKINTYEL